MFKDQEWTSTDWKNKSEKVTGNLGTTKLGSVQDKLAHMYVIIQYEVK